MGKTTKWFKVHLHGCSCGRKNRKTKWNHPWIIHWDSCCKCYFHLQPFHSHRIQAECRMLNNRYLGTKMECCFFSCPHHISPSVFCSLPLSRIQNYGINTHFLFFAESFNIYRVHNLFTSSWISARCNLKILTYLDNRMRSGDVRFQKLRHVEVLLGSFLYCSSPTV